MTEAFSGGCLCGAVRYRVAAAGQFPVYACHCTDCQKRSSSAFVLQQRVLTQALAIEGETAEVGTELPSGAAIRSFACGQCRTALYSVPEARPRVASLRAGTRDDSATLVPELHFWVRSKQPWVKIPEGATALETQPATFAELNALFGEPR